MKPSPRLGEELNMSAAVRTRKSLKKFFNRNPIPFIFYNNLNYSEVNVSLRFLAACI